MITLLLSYCISHQDQALHLAVVSPLLIAGPLLATFLMGFFLPFVNNIVSRDIFGSIFLTFVLGRVLSPAWLLALLSPCGWLLELLLLTVMLLKI